MIGNNGEASTIDSPQSVVISPIYCVAMPNQWFVELEVYSIEMCDLNRLFIQYKLQKLAL